MRIRGYRLLLVALLACHGTGCGLVTLAHDSILGPVSPIGRIHNVAVGSGFGATVEGVVAHAEGEARLRPYPRDIVSRLGSPNSFRALVAGLEAFFLGASTFADRRLFDGAVPDRSRIPKLGARSSAVWTALGPPQQWLRWGTAEVMVYRCSSERSTTLNLGVPPAIGLLIPVPGLANLAYRRTVRESRTDGFVLFFDEHGVLVASAPADVR